MTSAIRTAALVVGALAAFAILAASKPKPLPPPPMAPELYAAYEFRFRLLGNAECARYAQEADAVLTNAKLDDAARIAPLQAIGQAAQTANCLTPKAN